MSLPVFYAVPVIWAARRLGSPATLIAGITSLLLYAMDVIWHGVDYEIVPWSVAGLILVAYLAYVIASQQEQLVSRTLAAQVNASRLYRLQLVTASLANAQNVDEIVDIFHREAVPAARAQFGTLVLRCAGMLAISESADTTIQLREEVAESSMADGPQPVLQTLRTGTPIWMALVSPPERKQPANDSANGDTVRARAVLPVTIGESIQGALGFEFRDPQELDERHQLFLESIALQFSQAVERAMLVETERLARSESQAAEVRYRTLFESVVDATVLLGSDGTIVDSNVAATRLFGMAHDRLRGMRFQTFRIRGPNDAPSLPERIVSGEDLFEIEVRSALGAAAPVEVHARPVSLDGETYFLAVLRDISDRRSLERLRREMIAMVGHELKTPISTIKGIASGLSYAGIEWDAKTKAELISTIEDEADRLTYLVTDLLDTIRLELRGLQVDQEPCSLAEIVGSRRREIEVLCRGHDLQVDVPGDLPLVKVDFEQIGRVVTNLVSNAAKYAPLGTPIVVRADVEPVGSTVRVEVIDQGIGISPEDQERIFTTFYRVPNPDRSASGTGVGLTLARGIVEAHGGRIWVESAVGRGAAFSFTVPLVNEMVGSGQVR